MKYSHLFIPTLREAPADADIISAKLMQRAGMVRKLASGLYEWLPLGVRVLRRVERIIREEMNSIGGQEVFLPLLLPRELWDETGRWGIYGKELFRLQDRKDAEFCLGPTHEEAVTDVVRRDVRSYRQLPLMLYQIGTKFRDEIRPRFGVMRSREFVMKDAYSFHIDENDLDLYYEKAVAAYRRICERCGFTYRAVEAATGAIGGSSSHEFMVLAETGEEEIVWCDCGYGANVEKAECPAPAADGVPAPGPAERVRTPGIRSVDELSSFLKIAPARCIKTLVYEADGKPVIALVRGDHAVNEIKLVSVLGCATLFLAGPETVQKVTGAPAGFAGPLGLKEKVMVIADHAVAAMGWGVSGANEADHHMTNLMAGRDFTPDRTADIRTARPGDPCPSCGAALKSRRGIEVGHTFKLGMKYSRAMKAVYLDAAGAEQTMVMGCYGIGVTRIVAATIEQSHDEQGIVWPIPLAPFAAVVIPAGNSEAVRAAAEKIYTDLLAAGLDVVLDDRDERAGIKFKDADLIGIPLKIIVGEKNLVLGKAEVKPRIGGPEALQLVALEDVCRVAGQLLAAR